MQAQAGNTAASTTSFTPPIPSLASQGWGHMPWIQATRAKVGRTLSQKEQVTQDTEL